MKKRGSFTLLEMMVTLTLFSLLLGIFFYSVYAHVHHKKAYEKIRWPLLEERYLSERIDRLLSKATIINDEEEDILEFHGGKEKLLFTFDNGASEHPLLSYKTRCLLEKRGDLLLCTLMPLRNRGEEPMLTYPLLDKIDHLSFSYYQPEDPLALQVDPEKVHKDRPPIGERLHWEESYHALPAYVKLTLTRGERTAEFFFDLDYPLVLCKESN